jgi:hypothetical protein
MSGPLIRHMSVVIQISFWLAAITLDAAAGSDEPHLVAEQDRPIRETVEGALWHDSKWAWIVTDNRLSVSQASTDVRAAVAAFRAHFGIVPGKGGIIQSRYAGLYRPLKAYGLQWLVPWRFPQEGGALQSDQAHGSGGASALRHEIAHALFLALVIPSTRKGQYGGDAPDWLDEAAAIISESEGDISARRRAFSELVAGGRLKPLSKFVSAEHPVFASAAIRSAIANAKAENPTAPVVLSFKAQNIGLDRQAIGDFYAQSLATFHFLEHRTGDKRILALIAENFTRTRDPLSWIALIESGHSRADAISVIDAAFEDWSRTVSGRGD